MYVSAFANNPDEPNLEKKMLLFKKSTHAQNYYAQDDAASTFMFNQLRTPDFMMARTKTYPMIFIETIEPNNIPRNPNSNGTSKSTAK